MRISSIVIPSALIAFVLTGCSAVESTGDAVSSVGRGAGSALSGAGEAVGDAASSVARGAGDIVEGTGEAVRRGAIRTERKGY
jgi:hypothetical protein